MSDWADRARCRDEDPDLFFPVGRFRAADEQLEQARLICLECPVVQQCLDLAMYTGSDYGMWGGKTPEERAQLRRQAGRSAERIPRRMVGRPRTKELSSESSPHRPVRRPRKSGVLPRSP